MGDTDAYGHSVPLLAALMYRFGDQGELGSRFILDSCEVIAAAAG